MIKTTLKIKKENLHTNNIFSHINYFSNHVRSLYEFLYILNKICKINENRDSKELIKFS